MTGELSFFELGVADMSRAQAFYGALFGWEFEQVRDGFVISGAGLGGGIHDGDEGAGPYVFFAVEDMDTAVARVKELGGTADPVGGEGAGDEKLAAKHGRFMLCRDDQGSSFGLHEPPAR